MSMRLLCKQCGKEFQLTDQQIQFYRDKGLHLPKRCKACRQKNKNGEEQEITSTVKVYHLNNDKPNYVMIIIFLVLMLVIAGLYTKLSKVQEEKQPVLEKSTVVLNTVPKPETVTEKPVTEPTTEKTATEPPTEAPVTEPETEPVTEKAEEKVITYYLNTYRMKFHRPGCHSVGEMNVRNKQAFYGTRQEAIDAGYSPCHECNP